MGPDQGSRIQNAPLRSEQWGLALCWGRSGLTSTVPPSLGPAPPQDTSRAGGSREET